MTPGIVAESDLSGALKSEYVFFAGERVARRDLPSGAVAYYFSDHLKTASVITDSLGNIKSESDYYPWGGELQFVANDSNHYKFTGKERDETGLDYFGARYYSNGLARFITPDWAAKAAAVPYAEFADPQSLNLYTYVRNIPTTKVDVDGHDLKVAPELHAKVDLHRTESTTFNAELAAHEGPGSPNLTIQVGPTANDPNGQPSTGITNSQAVPHIETISDPNEDSTHYGNYAGSTVTINSNQHGDAVDDVLDHEMGHVNDARTNTDQSFRDSQHTKDTHGKQPHDDRPEEKKANAFKDKVKKEREQHKKDQKEEEKRKKNDKK